MHLPKSLRGAHAALFVLLALPGAPSGAVDDGAAASAAGAAAEPAPGAGLPADIELVYRTTASARLAGLPLTMHARTTTRWHRDGARYDASMHTDTIEFSQQSRGALQPDGGLAPARYSEKRPFHDSEAVEIDWREAQVRYAGAAPVAAPPAGAQDRLSLQFQFASQYRRHPEGFAAGRRIHVQLIGPHAVDDWTFTCVGEEPVETANGPVVTVHLAARRPVRDTEETMDIWMDKQSYHLPVRIRMVDRNQAVIDSVLQKLTLGPG